MTEVQWLTTDEPVTMLRFLGCDIDDPSDSSGALTDRQLRLFACANYREMADHSKTLVSRVEKFTDRHPGAVVLRSPRIRYLVRVRGGDPVWIDEVITMVTGKHAATATLASGGLPPKCVQADILRDILGNPFKLIHSFIAWKEFVKIAETLLVIPDFAAAVIRNSSNFTIPPLAYIKDEWLTPDVVRIASAIYDHHDFASLPVLADALEEARCDNAEILAHCRRPCPQCKDCEFKIGDCGNPLADGPGGDRMAKYLQRQCVCKGTRLARHWRGCCVVDLVLNKR